MMPTMRWQTGEGGGSVRRPALLVVYLAVFVDMLGFGIILPLLPFHAADLGGTGLWVGAVLTAYSAAQFVAAPVLGALSDRYGRKPLLLVSLAGSAVSLALTGVAGSLVTLLGARLVAGLFGGAIAVGQAYVVDLTEPAVRTRALGMVGASIGMGFVLGPAIGAGLSALGFAGVSFVAAGVALVNLVVGAVLLPRSLSAAATAPEGQRAPRSGNPVTPLAGALHMPGLSPPLWALFAATVAFAGMEGTYALLGARRYGLGPVGLGLVFTGVGVVIAVVQGGLVGRLADRFGDRRVAVAGAVLMAAGLAVIPVGSAWLNFVFVAVLAVGQGLLATTTAALIADAGRPALGGVLGVGQSAAAAGRAIGPLLAGAAFDVWAALPYLAGAVLCLLAAATLGRRFRGTAKDSTELMGQVA
jgi:DHA1 family tetracycline resistance protein-like MFS transporter